MAVAGSSSASPDSTSMSSVPSPNRLSITFVPSGENSSHALTWRDPGERPWLSAPVGGHDVQSVPGFLDSRGTQ